jgi:hypothetical protein
MLHKTALAAALLFAVAATAQAQKGKGGGGGGGHGPPPTVNPGVPPSSTHASPTAVDAVTKPRKSDDQVVEPKVKPAHATRAVKATPAVPGGKGKRATPAIRATPAVPPKHKNLETKAEDKTEKREFRDARNQSEGLMKHLKLTAAERDQFNSTRKKYDVQYRALEKQEHDADKAGTSDAAILSQLEQLRTQERAELRGFLTASQQAQFDRNAASWPKH